MDTRTRGNQVGLSPHARAAPRSVPPGFGPGGREGFRKSRTGAWSSRQPAANRAAVDLYSGDLLVPPGKRYDVSVWSSFSVYGTWAETQPDCITPFGVQHTMTARRSEYVAASTSGETLPLT